MMPPLTATPQHSDSMLHRWLLPVSLISLVLGADQWTKAWVLRNLGPRPGLHAIPLMRDWGSLVYVQNTGIAFGMFQNMNMLLTLTALLISLGAIYAYIFYLPASKWGIQISIGLMIGGALGNIVDRITLGYVVDFMRIGWWPVFNIADSAINGGVILLGLYLFFFMGEKPVAADPPSPQDTCLLNELLAQETPAQAARSRPTATIE